MERDLETRAHHEWLGYVQPVGLVVSIPALLAAQAHVNRNIAADHQRFLDCLPRDAHDDPISEIRDFAKFTQHVCGWRATDLEPVSPDDGRYAALEVPLREYGETLRPTHAVREVEPKDPQHPWMMLVQLLPSGTPLDQAPEASERTWHASPQARFERLLRESRVPVGLLSNATHLRLVYAPRGESSGFATFSVAEMAQVAGRPIFAALHMLLCQERLFSLGEKQRLPAILADSRKYQNVVSTQLAQQVLSALFELLRGFQSADDHRKGELLRAVLADDPNQVYSGLLTVLMRLVFILYAEDRGLLSSDSIYANNYSVTGLYDRLRADAGRYPDTMDQRYGGWAQLLTLFRLIYEGGGHGSFRLPARKGYLFDPERYPFLEGRRPDVPAGGDEKNDVPRVADGVIFRVLRNLLILDGERLSYRSLDVEQIGSVYEAMMGFNLEVAKARSIAIKPAKPHGAPTTINLEELLAAKPAGRAKWLTERTDQKLGGAATTALGKAEAIDDLLAALEKKIAREVTPNSVPQGAMIFQPSDERRRSGSHYTPRILTEPIVQKTLEPILKRLGDSPKPAEILDLKICDPAMGSGAFLVEACRQLGDLLVKSWHLHNQVPRIPPDEDEVLHARRLIAQRCLYGVDKNAMAVDLSKLSLWLATLAKDHPFTFLDHALRCGDSLVGLTRQQIIRFHWEESPQQSELGQERVTEALEVATRKRREILDAGDEVPFELKQQNLATADGTLNIVRFAGNLVAAAFFAGENNRNRQECRTNLLARLSDYLRTGNITLRPTKEERALRAGATGVSPFHWEIEFPEVFARNNPGFDCIVGNPPFMGGTKISSSLGKRYKDWLYRAHVGSGDRMDLVAYFLRRAFSSVRESGSLGLICTKTIAQGDTRKGGLGAICKEGGQIYGATRRMKWPGHAAVIVSSVNVARCPSKLRVELNGVAVDRITAFLFSKGDSQEPTRLLANSGLSFEGMKPYGQGFIFDDKDAKANTLAVMNVIIAVNPKNQEVIFPYVSGEDLNNSPTLCATRFVINFGQHSLEECRRWPEALALVETKVRSERLTKSVDVARHPWWQFFRPRRELSEAIRNLQQMLVLSRHGQHMAFAFLPAGTVPSEALVVFPFADSAAFALLQCRVHDTWARFFSSSIKDDLRYTPSDCFETFPFPEGFETHPLLESAGKEYYEFRAALMVKNNEGLTKTYNRFHDPHERSPEIKKLRELHAAMDRAVLDAYGWTDLQPTCEFLLDYEEEEDEEESSRARKKKKPWRYRWPDDFRDEVLARLLELNKQRAEQERLSGLSATKESKAGKGKAKKTTKQVSADTTFFEAAETGDSP
jgi:hypothetical protein